MLPVAGVSRSAMTSSHMSPAAAASPAMAAGAAYSARTVAPAARAAIPAVRTEPVVKEGTPAPTVQSALTAPLVPTVARLALTADLAQMVPHAGLTAVVTTPAAPTTAPARTMSAEVILVEVLSGLVERRLAAVMLAVQMRHLVVPMHVVGTSVALMQVRAALMAVEVMVVVQMRHLVVEMDAEEMPAPLTYLFVPWKDVAPMPVPGKSGLLVESTCAARTPVLQTSCHVH